MMMSGSHRTLMAWSVTIVPRDRVQNPDLWLDYERHRRKKVGGDHLKDLPGGQATPLHAVKTDTAVPASLRPGNLCRQAAVNEFFLFHGLNAPRFADSICRDGMDTKHCNLEGMFGSGLYFAEHSSKSNQYCPQRLP